jgi:hypothetical protein
MSDKDKKTQFEQSYKYSEQSWRNAWSEMQVDLRFYEDDQLSGEEKAFLRRVRRQPYIFNTCKKSVRLLTGYERKNRLSLKVGSENQESDIAAQQHTRLLMYSLNRNAGRGWTVFSDAFKYGAMIEGWNLVEFWPNRKGDVDFGRRPYNRFLLDPNFSNLNLSDCQYVLMGEPMTKEQAKSMVDSELHSEIDKIYLKGTGSTLNFFSRWPFAQKQNTPFKDEQRLFEKMWTRITVEKPFIVNKQTGLQVDYELITKWMPEYKKKMLLYQVSTNPQQFSVVRDLVNTVELTLFYNGEILKTYEDPYGIRDFNFELVAGDYQPEEDDPKLKINSLIRTIRDPQRAKNRRYMQMLDIAESQITTGKKAKEGTVLNPESLYMSGQGVPIIIKKDANMEDVQDLRANDIPQSFIQAGQIMDAECLSLLGVSDETFGASEKDIPMGLWQLRQGAALTIFQEFFDNFRAAKRNAGSKLIRMHQSCFPPSKVERICKEPVDAAFYDPDFERFDCQIEEGILTDTQRNMAYNELKQLKTEGAPIPWSMLFELMPSQLGQRRQQLMKILEQQQAQAQQAQLEQLQGQTMVETSLAQNQLAGVKLKEAQTVKAAVETMVAANELQMANIEQKFQQIMEIVDKGLQAKQIENDSKQVTQR